MLRIFLAIVFSFSSALATLAQDQSRAILVLDASGSMWGQIDGVPKITIAQNVVGDLLNTLPESQLLGLMAYGHRRKGDCSDIELLLEPTADRAEIAARVNALSPRGKTPMTDAVIAAAEALRFTEEKATVILVSDGIETCNPNVCEAARSLEQNGVDFTAHVIGFDVSNPEAIAQMQCLAEETGGSFRTASSAEELSEALQAVAEPEPAPEPVEVTFLAVDGAGGPVIDSDLVWTLATDAAGPLFENKVIGQIRVDMLPGSGLVEVLRTTDEATAEARFTVDDVNMTVTLVLPQFRPPATLEAPESAVAGSLIPVRWTGPGGDGDFITSADEDMKDQYYHHYTYTRDGDANTVMLRLPPNPGSAEIRYVLDDGDKVLARRVIEVTPLEIGFDVVDTAAAGSTIQVGWIGPDYKGDFITIADPDQGDGYYINYEYTREGNPMPLVMPTEPGIYEIRYVLDASRTVPGRTEIEVVAVQASLDAVDTAPAGSQIAVTWSGPEYDQDFISVAAMGESDNSYEAYEYTRDGNPAMLDLPLQPGEYELRYVVNQDRTVLARRPILVAPVSATLAAPATIAAGGVLNVSWTGPGYKNDYIDIAQPDASDSQYESYEYTREGPSLQVDVPNVPGEYVLRYIASGSGGRAVLTSQPLLVEAVGATLEAPQSVPAGGRITVAWTGPGYDSDYIDIAQPDASNSQYETYEYTREGSPLQVDVPNVPGEYVLRYILSGNDRQVLASQVLVVEPVGATLDAVTTAPAGFLLDVAWTGPGYDSDYIDIAQPDATTSQYETYEYTREGSPLQLKVPDQPGEYLLRYILSGDDRQVLASQVLVVQAVGATLDAPDTGAAGSQIDVIWTGPGGEADYISLAAPDAKPHQYLARAATKDGTPLALTLPAKPGEYELRYIWSGVTRQIIATRPITIE